MKFLREDKGRNFYDYICEGCQSEGEIGVLIDDSTPFACPEGCGATYIQWNDPMKAQPDLMCVVRPVFASATDDDDDEDYYDDDDDEDYYYDDDDDDDRDRAGAFNED